MSRFDGLVAGSPAASTATPSPHTTISRQPRRSGYDVSSNAIGVVSASGVARRATNVHSIRIVDSPPSPAGKLIDADGPLGHRPRAADRQPESGRLIVAGRRLGSRCLSPGDRAVAVGVHVLPLLERRDLGHVDDDVEADLVGGDGDPGEVVDREVAERVGVGRPGRDQRDGDGGDGEEGSDRATSHDDEGTRRMPKRMIGTDDRITVPAAAATLGA